MAGIFDSIQSGDYGSALDNGLEFAGNLLGNNNTPKPTTEPNRVVQPAATNYTPWIIGGAVALVAGIGLLLALKK